MLDKNKIQKLNETRERGTTICGVCYKPFIRQVGSIYKISYKGVTYPCCSYGCYRKAQKLKEGVIKEDEKENT